MKDPYLYEDVNVIKNIANIKEQKKLDDYETTMVNLGIIKLIKENCSIVKVKDICIIHKVLFENVYEWAGKYRIINIYKDEPVLNGLSVEYSNYKNIDNELEKIAVSNNKSLDSLFKENKNNNFNTHKRVIINHGK